MEKTQKTCSRCQNSKELKEYYRGNKSWCKKCHSGYEMLRRKNNPKLYENKYRASLLRPNMIYNRKKANAKQQGLNFTLDKNEFVKWYWNQELVCHYCGISPEGFEKTKDNHLKGKVNLGLDRKNNDEGYHQNNIVLCCNRCNSIKGGFFSYREMRKIGKIFVSVKWKTKGIKIQWN